MKINLPMAITAADSTKRTITGKIVTWNEEGNTSVGRTVFASNSIELKNVKLLLEHDRTRPIGKVVEFTETKDGIEATFKIANTMAGEDALVEASEGLRDGFSVGAMINEWTNDKGVMKITSASLEEVSLVTDPAIDSARVSEVAASENEAPKEDSEPATAEPDKPTEGEQVSDTTAPAPTEEAVEAAKVENVQAARPAFYTTPRLEFTKAKYLEASIRAKVLGDDESRQYVLAADDTTSNNSGLIPTRQLTEIINPLSNADRGFIDAISKGVLPDAGMTFEIPKITAVPTVGVEAEEATIDETGMTSSFVTVNVKKYAGGQEFSVELLDRSSPAFFDELVRQMEFAYAKATDLDVTAQIALATNVSDYTAQTADGLVKFCALTSAQIYDASLGFAKNLVVSPTQWGNIMGYAESSGRPIFNATNPSNAAGAVGPQSLRGNVAGLNLYVSRSIGVAANTSAANLASLFNVNPDSFTWYESSRFRLQTDVVATGQIKVAYYGYGALAAKVVNGIRHNNTIGA
jgi:HK97 family phage prohead protease